jgi:lipopolysaccharide/colanic/teichoic acid biosynthesis glycosyltransferase
MLRRAARPLFFAGVVVIVFGLGRIHSSRESYDLTNSFRFAWEITYAVLMVIAAYGAGLPDLPRTRRQAMTSAIGAPLIAALAISTVQLLTGDALLPRFVVFGTLLLMVPWALFCTALARGGRLRAESRDRVILVAVPTEAMALRDELDAEPERPAVLLNHLLPAQAMSSDITSKPLTELVVRTGANVVVLDRIAIADPTILSQVAALHENGIRVRTLSLFYEEWLGKLPMSELERESLLFDIREVHGARYLRVKRVIDVFISLVGAAVLLVVFPFVVVGNLLANRGPVFYRQERVGKAGRCFTILKFRTMRDGEGLPSEWTQADDPRVTPFGRFLRRTHLDELPQVVNVVRGDLSIVGPRPEQPRYVEELLDKLPFYNLRHLVRPGLTGWAQVKYGYAGDERDALEKLQYEFWYLRNQGLLLDARIIGRTVRSVIGTEGRGR